MQIIKSKKTEKIIGFKMNEETFKSLRDEYMGICFSCGQEAYSVEPDARGYTCEGCGEKKVFGVEEILIMGKIIISGEE